MVVKPWGFITRGLAQLAVKCRGHEYLRIIYGRIMTFPKTCRACARAAWLASARWLDASSPWALKHWNTSSDAGRGAPNQAMRTQNITTAEDAAFDDQRLDGSSVEMSGRKTDRSHENLGTPVNAPAPAEEKTP